MEANDGSHSNNSAAPSLLAYREATALQFPRLVKKLTAYIASVKDTRAIDCWIAGSESYKGVEERLRLSYRLAKVLHDHEDPQVAQAWLMGLNPELTDRAPSEVLRDEDLAVVGPEILGAVRAFLARA